MKQVDQKKQKKVLWITIAVILCVCIVASAILFSIYYVDSSVKPQVDDNAKNVILLIGDGMGEEHIKAGELYEGSLLTMQKFPTQGEVVTRSLTPPFTDSAAAATAMATGYKTYNSRISYKDGKNLTTIAEEAMAAGKKVGVVATKSITDATPAAFLAHAKDRDMSDEIAEQMLNSGVDVLFGLNDDSMRKLASQIPTLTRDYCTTFEEIASSSAEQIVGLFDEAIPTLGANTLSYLTEKALDVLSKNNDNGFFLMIEGSKIDSYSHDNDMEGMLRELRAFDEAVSTAKSWASKNGDTAVIVVADHETGNLTIPDGATMEDLIDYEKSNNWFKSTTHTNSNVRYFIYNVGSAPVYGDVPTGEFDDQGNQIYVNAITSYKEETLEDFPDKIDNTDIYRLIKQLLF